MPDDALEQDFRVGAGCRTIAFWVTASVVLGGFSGYGLLKYQIHRDPQNWGMGVIVGLPLYVGIGAAVGLMVGLIVGAMRADFSRARRQAHRDAHE